MLAEKENAQGEGASGANAGPDGVSRSDRNAFLSQPEQPGAEQLRQDRRADRGAQSRGRKRCPKE